MERSIADEFNRGMDREIRERNLTADNAKNAKAESTKGNGPERASASGVRNARLWNGFLAGLLALVALDVSTFAEPAGRVPERLLVKPKRGVPEAQLQAIFASHRAQQVDAIRQIDVRVLHVPEERFDRVLGALQNNADIEFAEPDVVLAPDMTPNDPWYPNEWHLPNINAPLAWDITTGSTNVVIAILDTGVDQVAQPDLTNQCVAGWNFYDNNADTTDVYGHGTPVAGTAAAASNNGWGVASVAANCKIMPLRVSDTNGNAAWSLVGQALTYAADHGARVANISYKASDSSTVQTAAKYMQGKGGVTTVSAGNDGTFDSSADCPYLLTVGATTANNVLTSWSSYGNNQDLVAPGQGIYTTCRGGAIANWAGTSFSAPIVAGVAALVFSVNPNLSGVQVYNILEQTATQLGGYTSWNSSYGYGLVNAYKAVLAAGGIAPTNSAPIATITAPAPGSTVSNSVTINVTATDTSDAVTTVKCYLNGTCVATNPGAPAAFSWITTGYPNGSYALQALAIDAAGNSGTSSVVNVTVQNTPPDTAPPIATITAPTNSSTVRGTVGVSVSATDTVGVTKVEWYLSGTLMNSSSSASVTFLWYTTNYANATYALQAKAYDAAGNVGTSSPVSVTVQNSAPDTIPPTVQLLSPINGATLSGVNSVNVSATDNVGVTQVAWLLDGSLVNSSATASAAFAWDTTKSANGPHSVQAAGYDAAGNVGTSATITVTVTNSGLSVAPPGVAITSPTSGSTITSKITKVYVTTSTAATVTNVTLVVDGKNYSSSTSSSPVFSWNTSKLSKGAHTVQAVAYDNLGNSNRSTVVTVYK